MLHRTVSLRFALFVLPLFIFSLAACSGGPGSGSTATVPPSHSLTSRNATTTPVANSNPNSNLLAVLPLMHKSLQAMQQVKSFHVAIQGKGTIQTSGDFLPKLATGIPYSLHATADIDIAHRQGQAYAHLKLLPPQAAALSLKATARLLDHWLYLRGPNCQWFSLDLVSTLAFLKVQAMGQPQNLLTLIGDVTVTDHGITTLEGKQARHLTLIINQHALDQIMDTVRQHQVKQALASIQTPAGIGVDLFLDNATSLLVRAQIKGGFSVNVDELLKATGQTTPSTLVGNQARMLTISFALTVTLSKFNQQVLSVVLPHQVRPIDLMLLLASL
jgi:hypothetical protein